VNINDEGSAMKSRGCRSDARSWDDSNAVERDYFGISWRRSEKNRLLAKRKLGKTQIFRRRETFAVFRPMKKRAVRSG